MSTRPVHITVEAPSGPASIYIKFADAPAFSETKTVSESPLVNIDYAGDGTVLGVEIIA